MIYAQLSAASLKGQRIKRLWGCKHWKWHFDEMYAALYKELVYLWHATDQEGEILESHVTKSTMNP